MLLKPYKSSVRNKTYQKAVKELNKTDLNSLVTHVSLIFSIFELGGITKHLMTGPTQNSEFCFPSTLNVPLAFASGNIEDLGETKLAVSLGASIKCLI